MFNFPIKRIWNRYLTKKASSISKEDFHHDLRSALRNYFDILYTNPDSSNLEKALKDVEKIYPELANYIK